MNAISYTAARENLAATMDKVCEDHAPIIITRNRDQAVVMMSLADYEALEETAYLLKSPANARRIMDAIAQLDAGKGIEREIDLDACSESSSFRMKLGKITSIGRALIVRLFDGSMNSSRTSSEVHLKGSANRNR
jgi:antitoxin YefM